MIAVMTCPRPDGVNYLQDLICDIDTSALGSRVIVSDTVNDGSTAPDGWNFVTFDRPQFVGRPDNKFAFLKCVELARDAGEDLIVLEDDVRLSAQAAWYMERFVVPSDVALVSFYDPWFERGTPCGLWRSKMHGFAYSQALKLPLRTCESILLQVAEILDDSRRVGSDNHLQTFGMRRDWLCAIHVPGIVQHVGATSAVGNGDLEGRTSRSFRGPDFDPRTFDRRLFL